MSIEKKDLVAVKYALRKDKGTTGPLVQNLKKKFVYILVQYALSCNGGTSALYLAFKQLIYLKMILL